MRCEGKAIGKCRFPSHRFFREKGKKRESLLFSLDYFCVMCCNKTERKADTLMLFAVAAPTGGVGRNMILSSYFVLILSRRPHGWRGLKYLLNVLPARGNILSPPPRVAWVEITSPAPISTFSGGRRPHGWRGLKCKMLPFLNPPFYVAAPTGGVG